MKKILIILALNIYLFSSETTQSHKFKSSFGFLANGTLLQNFKDARVALAVWLEDIASMHNSDIKINFYNSNEDIFEDFRNTNKLDMIVMPLPFYFENKLEINSIADNFWSLSIDKHKYTQYYLIGRKGLKKNGFKGLINSKISLKDEDSISEVWLDKNSYLVNKVTYKDIVKIRTFEKKESTVLLRVFFGRSDFGIVSSRTWNTMIELNPAIKKRVEIIKKSKRMHLPFIGFFKKSASKKSIEAFFNLSKDLRNLPRSEQIMTLLKFDSVFKVEENSISELENFYNEYFILKKKYK